MPPLQLAVVVEPPRSCVSVKTRVAFVEIKHAQSTNPALVTQLRCLAVYALGAELRVASPRTERYSPVEGEMARFVARVRYGAELGSRDVIRMRRARSRFCVVIHLCFLRFKNVPVLCVREFYYFFVGCWGPLLYLFFRNVRS